MVPRVNSYTEPELAVGKEAAVEVWRRRKWLAVLVFVPVVAGAISLTLSLPDIYRATATVLVERQEVSEAFVRRSVTAELETRIQTIQQRVMSRERLADLITRMDLYPELRRVVPLEALVERMRKEIQPQFKAVEQSTGRSAMIAFSLSYSGRDPQRVAEVANTLAAFYGEENATTRERQAEQTATFLQQQLAEVKRDLDEQERRASEFALLHTDELPEQLQANLAALDRLNTQLRLNSEYQIRAIDRRERLEADAAFEREQAGRRYVAPTAPADSPAARLARLQGEFAVLRRRYSDLHPDMIRIKADIAALEAEVGRPHTNGAAAAAPAADPAERLTRAIHEVDRELSSLRQEEGELRRMIGEYEARVASTPRRQHERQQLSRGYEMTKERYQTLLKRYEDAQLAARLEQGQSVEHFRVLDPAIPPRAPVAPNRPWLMFMGLAAALALAAAAVVIAERVDTTFHSADDLRAFIGASPLATIRLLPRHADARRRRYRVALWAAAVALGALMTAGAAYYVASDNEQMVRLTARGGV